MTYRVSVCRRVRSVAVGLALASAATTASAQEAWVFGTGDEPLALLAPGGNALLAVACGRNGTVELRSMVFGRPGYSRQLPQELEMTTGNWSSGPMSLESTPDGDAYAIELDPAGQVVSALRFAPSVKVSPEGKEAFGFDIPLEGFAASLDALLAECGPGEAPAPQQLAVEPVPERKFNEADKVAAARLIVSAQCQPGNPAAYCANPDVLALRAQQIEAAAAAIGRGLDPRRRPDIVGNDRPALMQRLSHCSNDAACLQAFLSERIAFWDSVHQPLSDEVLAALGPDVREACRTAIMPSAQLACTDQDLAAAEARLRTRMQAVRAEVSGTAFATEFSAAFDESIAGIYETCPGDAGCLARRYAAVGADIEAWRSNMQARVAQAAERDRQRAEAEQELAATRATAAEARRLREAHGRDLVASASLGPALGRVSDDDAMMAFWNHEATAIDTPELADAAMRILFTMDYHVKNCVGQGAVSLPITVTVTTTTRNGFGVYQGEEVDRYDKVLTVRPVYRGLARRLVQFYSDNILNRRFVAVRDLISQEGCDSVRLRRLEEGLAMAAGVTLPPFLPALPEPGSVAGDWRAFTATCADASYPEVTNNRGSAAVLCIVAEVAAAAIGDREVYEAIRDRGLMAGPGWGDDPWSEKTIEAYNAAFEKAYERREGARHRGAPVVEERTEIYLRENGL